MTSPVDATGGSGLMAISLMSEPNSPGSEPTFSPTSTDEGEALISPGPR